MQKNITVQGRVVSYLSTGAGPKTIIFLHGWRSNAEAWRPILDRLDERGYALYALDLPGFGASEMPQTAMTLEGYAEIVRAFAEAAGIGKGGLTLVGHSFGARVAAKIAADGSGFAERVILVASGGDRQAPMARAAKMILAKIMKPFFAPSFMRPLRARIYRAMGAEDYVATPELRQTLMNVIGEDLAPLLPRIKTETLVIWGECDETAPLAYGKKMAKAIPGARLEIMNGAGHYCFAEQPDRFVRLLKGFLNGK